MIPLKTSEQKIQLLREQIDQAESQLRNLKVQLHEAELAVRATHEVQSNGVCEEKHTNGSTSSKSIRATETTPTDGNRPDAAQTSSISKRRWSLEQDEYRRYGRQLIMPQVGLKGQLRLKHARVLITGVGGLGCPAAAYLAGAGVGTLGLMDGDTVEISNLHRQIAHSTSRVGCSKVDSAHEYLQLLNPLVKYDLHRKHLSPDQAISIFEAYDLILDCTDHPTSRYLISDACVLAGKPLVSASALKTEGQLIILNDPPRLPGDTTGGPCYRCIFPKPPPAESVLSCGEGGILGPVVGTMGVLQALEAIKLLTAGPTDRETNTKSIGEPVKPSMLMFSALGNPQFRSVRLRSRRSNCAVCSAEPSITTQSLTSGSLDYVAFCGAAAPINVLPPQSRVSAKELADLPHSRVVIDVRDETQYAMCALEGSVSVPWTGNGSTWLDRAKQKGVLDDPDGGPKYLVCRFGNDSQLAAKAILDDAGNKMAVRDVIGGFQSWRTEVNTEWPDY